MSTAPEIPNTRLVVAGASPRCSDHSGSTTCRVARTAPTSTTATPSVASSGACRRTSAAEETASRWRGAPCGSSGSPARPTTSAAATLVPTASQNTDRSGARCSSPAPRNGPRNAPIRL